MRKLESIIKNIDYSLVQGSTKAIVKSIEFDSRKVTNGALFFAVVGEASDGHDFINQAIESGAVAIICERELEIHNSEICVLKVEDCRTALSSVVACWFDYPANDIKVIGITGTNGKTTTATMLYETFEDLGYVCGLFSTVKILIHGEELPATHTTPDPITIHRTMAKMRDAGCEFCFMEVSSHSICQKRILDIPFRVAVFSNITQDHLDYHKTFKEYIYAKKTLFDMLDSSSIAIYNSDDRNGSVMVQNSPAKHISYGLKNMADYKVKLIEKHLDGMLLNIEGQDVWTKLTGEFNAYNLLATYATAVQLYPNSDEVLKSLSKRNPVRGRFELVENSKGIHVIIDYAHTPDAIKNVLEAVRDLRNNNERVITVVGAGGNR